MSEIDHIVQKANKYIMEEIENGIREFLKAHDKDPDFISKQIKKLEAERDLYREALKELDGDNEARSDRREDCPWVRSFIKNTLMFGKKLRENSDI